MANILLIHSNELEYWLHKKTKFAEEVAENKKHAALKPCLVCFIALQQEDAQNIEGTAASLCDEILRVSNELNEKNVAIYPYVHLLFGKKPCDANSALTILKLLEEKLKKHVNVLRVPFGFYKEFKLHCKGHPLSELSREVIAKATTQALEKEKELASEWYIIQPDGTLHRIKFENEKLVGFDFSKHKNLESFAKYEMKKSRKAEKQPMHVRLMKQLELADYEEGSDPGNLRYPPNGKLIKNLLASLLRQKLASYGAYEIESPEIFDVKHPALKHYLERFPARQYIVNSPNKILFMRFAACFGQFLMLSNLNLSYKHLPLRIYELAKYCYRVEQRGELSGLRRLRAFTMPDCHAFCADLQQAKEELLHRFKLCKDLQKNIGVNAEHLELAVRVVKSFWDEHKELVLELVKEWGKPALLEIWPEQFFYFVLKYEFNFVDSLQKAAALTTDQIDVENAKRYGIKFTDKDNMQKYPIILHCSPSGALERVMYALIEQAHMQSKNPMLPLWLTPVQVRLCPINEGFIPHCEKIAQELAKNNIRVDIDDRNETINKKIRDAEHEWIPFVVVIGKKEAESNTLAVRFRETQKVKNISLNELINIISEKCKNKPFLPLPYLFLSKRPNFVAK